MKSFDRLGKGFALCDRSKSNDGRILAFYKIPTFVVFTTFHTLLSHKNPLPKIEECLGRGGGEGGDEGGRYPDRRGEWVVMRS